MSLRMHRLPVAAAAAVTALLASMVFAQAAATPDQPAKAMIKREPMAGGMKKDGMMKEDVSKAARKWNAKMDESMKREKMK